MVPGTLTLARTNVHELEDTSPRTRWGLHPAALLPVSLVSRPSMTRRSLRPQLNQIRTWVRQGRTDAWIAHQLEVTVQQIQAFKREQSLEPDGDGAGEPRRDEIDLRAEDDARSPPSSRPRPRAAPRRRPSAAEEEAKRAAEEAAEAAEAGERRRGAAKPKKPPRRRGGRTAAARKPPGRWRARSTTARRATACGSTPPSRTIPSTPSTGPATGRSRSRSRRTRS